MEWLARLVEGDFFAKTIAEFLVVSKFGHLQGTPNAFKSPRIVTRLGVGGAKRIEDLGGFPTR